MLLQSMANMSAILIMLIMTALLFLPPYIVAHSEWSNGIIKYIGLESKSAPEAPKELIVEQINEDQDIDLSKYTELEMVNSTNKHTIIAQVNLDRQNANTAIQLNELMNLIDEAKEKCWRITGFTSFDPFLFVLFEAFTC